MPALDGLRALAVLGVMGFHAQAPGFAVGFFGVDVFFVLSGYLISTILLEQCDRDGRIAYRAFYLHRLLRLSQALLTMLAAYALLAPLVWPGRPHVLHAALSALYVTDYSLALWGPPRLLSHTWSLSVEEHFYLLWPPLLAWAARRWGAATLPRALFALTAAATVWRLACLLQGQGWNAIYYRFDTRLSGLLLGASLAALIRDPGVARCSCGTRMCFAGCPSQRFRCCSCDGDCPACSHTAPRSWRSPLRQSSPASPAAAHGGLSLIRCL